MSFSSRCEPVDPRLLERPEWQQALEAVNEADKQKRHRPSPSARAGPAATRAVPTYYASGGLSDSDDDILADFSPALSQARATVTIEDEESNNSEQSTVPVEPSASISRSSSHTLSRASSGASAAPILIRPGSRTHPSSLPPSNLEQIYIPDSPPIDPTPIDIISDDEPPMPRRSSTRGGPPRGNVESAFPQRQGTAARTEALPRPNRTAVHVDDFIDDVALSSNPEDISSASQQSDADYAMALKLQQNLDANDADDAVLLEFYRQTNDSPSAATPRSDPSIVPSLWTNRERANKPTGPQRGASGVQHKRNGTERQNPSPQATVPTSRNTQTSSASSSNGNGQQQRRTGTTTSNGRAPRTNGNLGPLRSTSVVSPAHQPPSQFATLTRSSTSPSPAPRPTPSTPANGAPRVVNLITPPRAVSAVPRTTPGTGHSTSALLDYMDREIAQALQMELDNNDPDIALLRQGVPTRRPNRHREPANVDLYQLVNGRPREGPGSVQDIIDRDHELAQMAALGFDDADDLPRPVPRHRGPRGGAGHHRPVGGRRYGGHFEADVNDYEAMLRLDDNVQKKGVDKELLASLPVVSGPDDSCTICLGTVEDAALVSLPCLHHFHRPCIVAHCKTSRLCPNCRTEIQ